MRTPWPLFLPLILLLNAVGTLRGEPAAAPAKANLKLLTWNIQMLPTSVSFASRRLQKQQHRRAPWIIEYLCQQDYDIVVLQEVIDPQITALLKAGLAEKYPHLVAPPSQAGISGTTGGLLFVSRIPLKYLTHIVFQNTRGIDTLAEKGCVLVEAERDGVRFQIAGTHLQAGHAEVRHRQVPEIQERVLERYGQPGLPQFLVGDLNIVADEADAAPFQRLLRLTQMSAFPLDDPHPFTVDGRNSWNRPTHTPRHIDHVLCNARGTQTTVLRQTIQRARRTIPAATNSPTSTEQVIDYSDHYGVVAEILLQR